MFGPIEGQVLQIQRMKGGSRKGDPAQRVTTVGALCVSASSNPLNKLENMAILGPPFYLLQRASWGLWPLSVAKLFWWSPIFNPQPEYMLLDTKNDIIGPCLAILAQIVWKVCEECVKVWKRMCESV